jgi:hypothetical protein
MVPWLKPVSTVWPSKAGKWIEYRDARSDSHLGDVHCVVDLNAQVAQCRSQHVASLGDHAFGQQCESTTVC